MPSCKAACLAVALSVLRTAAANCILENYITSDISVRPSIDDDALCTPQADGNYQFAMSTSLVVVPTFDSEDVWAGRASAHSFIIYSKDCVAVFAGSPSGNDCGLNYEIDYFEGKPIVIDRIDWSSAEPAFRFQWEGEDYASWDGRCGGCTTDFTSGGLRAVGKCKCGFYAGSGPPDDLGTCDVTPMTFAGGAAVETNEALCTLQAEGNYQLTMVTDGQIRMYDSACVPVAIFDINSLPSDCGAPLKLHFFEGLDILVTEYDPQPDGLFPGFGFDFNGRSYRIGDAWCGICEPVEDGSDDVKACQCGFYVGA